VLVIAMMDGTDAAVGYAYGHAWEMERVRLAGLEAALTRARASI
jgi:CO dehydrogenase/acetyl-CoA synthase delta subunit